jgi:SNF2 Helicase protein/SNF2-related domain
MLVVHGTWAYGTPMVWAEDSGLPPQAPPRRGRPSRAPRPHPFAAQPDVLADALADVLSGSRAQGLPRKAVDDEITLYLPSTGSGPLGSPELPSPELPGQLAAADGATSAVGPPSLAAWRVPVLVFEPTAAPAVLTTLAELAPGDIVAGASIGYLAAAARFADDLAARGRVLPAFVAEDGGYVARWRPVLSAADARHARELAAAMPPSCRALADSGLAGTGLSGPGAGAAPGPLLADMLDVLADASVRTRLPDALLPARRGRRPARIDVAERMLLALAGPQPVVEVADAADERAAQDLAAAFADWLSSTARPADSVRTCFRLVEPHTDETEVTTEAVDVPAAGAESSDAWRVEFSLQSAEDPSLMLPAADVWSGAGYGWLAGGLLPHAGHPEEELLAGLGTAARLFPALDGALREAAPAQVTLDTAGALDFLRNTGSLLAAAGFGVLMPDWARRARLGLKLTARSSSSGSSASGRPSQFGLQDLVSFRYDLALGDDVLEPEELAELARLKVPLVRVRGQWVELDDRHLKAALKFLADKQPGTMTAAEVLGAAIGAGGAPGELPLTEVDVDGWLGDLLSGHADERLAPAQTPEGFRGTLRPYQRRGLSWLSFLSRLGIGAILADDMGLGKTVQLLSLLWAERAKNATVRDESGGATLLICPMSLTGNWQREAQRFTPELAVHVHHGADRLTGDELTAALTAADLVITTYQTAARDLAALSAVRWSRVVCDETQTPDTRTEADFCIAHVSDDLLRCLSRRGVTRRRLMTCNVDHRATRAAG